MRKKFILILSALAIVSSFTGCSKEVEEIKSEDIESTVSTEDEGLGSIKATIELGDNIKIDGLGATVENNKIIIKEGGTYNISGILNDGQIVVDAGDEDDIELIFNGVNITSNTTAPIYVMNANNTHIKLADGSENFVTDGDSYVLEDITSDEPNATIFSKDDLTIKGNGSLVVSANYNNGITSKDDLKIKGGNITVNSVGDGLRGKDSITISEGNINIDAKEDGMKSTNLKKGSNYLVCVGGTSTGTATDGLYSDGSYSGGTKALDFTISSSVTNVSQEGAISGGIGNHGGMKGPGGNKIPGNKPQMPN